ncbi:MAG TPA: hypothetical protein DCP20_02385 [Coriobacteriia bacterium]|nr:hypothetical protein [Coriobacteriia bacterium]
MLCTPAHTGSLTNGSVRTSRTGVILTAILTVFLLMGCGWLDFYGKSGAASIEIYRDADAGASSPNVLNIPM